MTVLNRWLQQPRTALGTAGSDRCADWARVQEMLLQKHLILPLAAPKYYWFSHNTGFVTVAGAQLLEPYSLRRTR